MPLSAESPWPFSSQKDVNGNVARTDDQRFLFVGSYLTGILLKIGIDKNLVIGELKCEIELCGCKPNTAT